MPHLVMLEKDNVRIRVAEDAVAEHLILGWSQNVGFEVDAQSEDLRFPVSGINPPGAASDPARDTTDGRLAFSATVDNVIAIQAQMPHAWAEGTAITPHLHWSPTNTNTGNVKWRLEYKISDVDGTFPGSWTTVDILDAGDGVADQHQLASFGEIAMSDNHISCMLLIKISRLATDIQDTYNADAKLNEFDIHYLANSLGSNESVYK